MSTAASTPSTLEQQRSAELYHDDPYSWSLEQADALRRRDFASVDWENVIEEIEAVSRNEASTWVSNCANAIEHMLKIEHCKLVQPYVVRNWSDEIPGYRDGMETASRKNPGITSRFDELFREAWNDARNHTLTALSRYDVEHKLSPDRPQSYKRRNMLLPRECPYDFADVTGIFHVRGDRKPHYDRFVLPPSIQKIVDERCRDSPSRDR
ncbi:MAG: DUF29 domain-containing protein [Bryobacterales bacterium]|nr:DUF29 domain-containing protein [Bryobacterales bacterium]MDE0296082.1 DUF29 domain-containing protein [Bryobacterales bacterium]